MTLVLPRMRMTIEDFEVRFGARPTKLLVPDANFAEYEKAGRRMQPPYSQEEAERLLQGVELIPVAAQLYIAIDDEGHSCVYGSPGKRAHEQPHTEGWSRPIPNSYWIPGSTILAGEYPGHAMVGEARSKLRALLDAGVDSFVDLTTVDDSLEPYEQIIAQIAGDRARGIRYKRLPIPDMSVGTMEDMAQILRYLEAEQSAGRTVYLHCWGGVGRTGTVVGCWLVHNGRSGDDALKTVRTLFSTMSSAKVRRHPEGSPQTAEQRAMIRRWKGSTGRVSAGAARGCLLGGALGDALGAPVEFMKQCEIVARFGEGGIRSLERSSYGRPGLITDDTQMTLFTAEGLLRASSTGAVASVREAYLRWLGTQGHGQETDQRGLAAMPELNETRAPGNTCLTALSVGGTGSRAHPLNNSKGCGGVMRVAPVGLIGAPDPFTLAADIAAITHGHPSGYLAAGAMAVVIDRVGRGTALSAAIDVALARLQREPGHQETAQAIASAQRLASVPSSSAVQDISRLGEGWVAEEALAIALYCCLRAEGDFKDAIRMAVNHDGDSDSTGAIAGNIMGAIVGEHGLPASWLEKLELRDVIAMLADHLAQLAALNT